MSRLILYHPYERRVTLDPLQLNDIWHDAQLRQAPKNNSALPRDKRIMQRDNVKTHFVGLLGEVAVAPILGLRPSKRTGLCGDTKADFYLNGIAIEVKTLRGYLAFRNLREFEANVAVLVVWMKSAKPNLEPPFLKPLTVWIQGWITQEEFKNHYFIDDFGYGPRPCLQPCDLHAISSLRNWCESGTIRIMEESDQLTLI